VNPKPLDQAKDADLRGVMPALQRAADYARRWAEFTQTTLVIVEPDAESVLGVGVKNLPPDPAQSKLPPF
jgi:hypothetical protein